MSCFPLCCGHWLLTLSYALHYFHAKFNASPHFSLWRRNSSHKMMATHASSICFSWRLAFMFLAVAFSGVALPPPEIGLLKIDGTQRLFRIQYIPYHANCSIRISGRNMDRTSWRAFLMFFFWSLPTCMLNLFSFDDQFAYTRLLGLYWIRWNWNNAACKDRNEEKTQQQEYIETKDLKSKKRGGVCTRKSRLV